MNPLDIDLKNPNYEQLSLACKHFTPENLTNEKHAISLILLFQKNISQLPTKHVNAAVGAFKQKFPDINVEALFLKKLISYCEKNQEKSFLLIGEARQWNLSNVEKKTQDRWLTLFKTFKVTMICSFHEEYDFPRVLLQSNKVDQKLLHSPLRFESTSITVAEVFDKYLCEGKIGEDPFFKDPHLWVQLYDVARRFGNVELQALSYDRLCEIDHDYLYTSALTNVQKGKFERAIKLNPYDALSHEALGDQFLKEKKFKEAWGHFKKGLKLCPFRYDLYLKTAESLIEYIRQFRQDYQAPFIKLLKRLHLSEEIKPDLIDFLLILKDQKLIEQNIMTTPLLDIEKLKDFGVKLKMKTEEILLPLVQEADSLLKKFPYLFEAEVQVAEFQLLKVKFWGKIALTPFCDLNEEDKRWFVLQSDEHALNWSQDILKKNMLDFDVHLAYALALHRTGRLDEAEKHFKMADPYSACANYYLGHYKKAVKLALVEPLELCLCLEMANHFLKNDPEEEMVEDLATIFIETPFKERFWEISHILFCLSDKIQDIEMKEMALKKAQELAAKPFPQNPAYQKKIDDLFEAGKIKKARIFMGVLR